MSTCVPSNRIGAIRNQKYFSCGSATKKKENSWNWESKKKKKASLTM